MNKIIYALLKNTYFLFVLLLLIVSPLISSLSVQAQTTSNIILPFVSVTKTMTVVKEVAVVSEEAKALGITAQTLGYLGPATSAFTKMGGITITDEIWALASKIPTIASISTKAELATGLRDAKVVASSYNTLDAMTAGARATTKTEIHHLLEKRMVENMKKGTFIINETQVDSKIPSIVLDEEIHQQITRELQQRMPYVTQGSDPYSLLNKDSIIKNYKEVYKKFGMESYVDEYVIPLLK